MWNVTIVNRLREDMYVQVHHKKNNASIQQWWLTSTNVSFRNQNHNKFSNTLSCSRRRKQHFVSQLFKICHRNKENGTREDEWTEQELSHRLGTGGSKNPNATWSLFPTECGFSPISVYMTTSMSPLVKRDQVSGMTLICIRQSIVSACASDNSSTNRISAFAKHRCTEEA